MRPTRSRSARSMTARWAASTRSTIPTAAMRSRYQPVRRLAPHEDESTSKLSAYVIRNQLDLFSNFTYFLDDPVNGDQFSQPDRRVTSGVDASHTLHTAPRRAMASDLTVGAAVQNDNIFNRLVQHAGARSACRPRAKTMSSRPASASMSRARCAGTTGCAPWPACAPTLPLRCAQRPGGQFGPRTTSSVSPSLSLVFGPFARTEFYAELRPWLPQQRRARHRSPSIPRPASRGAVALAGAFARLRSSACARESVRDSDRRSSLFRLDFDSELLFVGDAGTTEAGPAEPPHRHRVLQLLQAVNWLSVDCRRRLCARALARRRAGRRPHPGRRRRRGPAGAHARQARARGRARCGCATSARAR